MSSESAHSDSRFLSFFSYLSSCISSLQQLKKELNLKQPGSFDNLGREAKNVSPTHLLFEGGKLDLGKILSNQFQVSHSFNLAAGTLPSTYHFGTVFVGKSVAHFNLIGKVQLSMSQNLTAKCQCQISSRPGYSMFQSESEYLGRDYTLNAKAINFDPTNLTGVFSLGYLQSVSKNGGLALGIEGILQRPMPEVEDAGMTFIAKYTTDAKSIFVANIQNFIGVQLSYFHRVNESIEFAADMQTILAGPQREALATVSCKMEHRQASVRASLDSQGKLGMFLEERLFGRLALLISGEIDHLKGRNKFGVGLAIES
ncbi:hypothetical protein DI09_9p290 [Mitosporidium daphniae]|uniref:Uncharacterized protein n=1 Tax=Mitosporidium daphniae TaxID=1485682 RepID=A0A098VQG6_9MICR|nr:uncharacterized protein DI09_9p290 [Mitosporidium daphniae]KGG49946.1 hypothetical protein DI09_9p290 [Mitosporidium daphniae]|eukprot:XP_013236373.1 uncharacterized protein DI09_9p290 [Mitosporidium daphniae]